MLLSASLLSPRSSEAESNMSSAFRPEPRRTEGSACFLLLSRRKHDDRWRSGPNPETRCLEFFRHSSTEAQDLCRPGFRGTGLGPAERWDGNKLRLRVEGLTTSGVRRSLHMFVGSLTEASEQVRAVSLALGNGPTIMCCGRAAPILASANPVKATERFRPRPGESASRVSVSPRTR